MLTLFDSLTFLVRPPRTHSPRLPHDLVPIIWPVDSVLTQRTFVGIQYQQVRNLFLVMVPSSITIVTIPLSLLISQFQTSTRLYHTNYLLTSYVIIHNHIIAHTCFLSTLTQY